MAVGLQNIRLLTESRQRSEQLQMVSGFVQSLQQSLDMAHVMKTVLNDSQHVIPVEWVQVLVYDSRLNGLREFALYALYRLSVNHIDLDKGPLLSLGDRTPAAHVSDTSRASWELPESASNIRSLLVAPMRSLTRSVGMFNVGTKPLGIFSVGHTRPFAYNETDAIVFQQMTDQLATAIENALLYDRNQREARDEALINDIAVRLQQQSHVENMLHIVVNDLGQALGARRARIRLGTEAPPIPHGDNDAVE